MTRALRALIGETPEKAGRIARLAHENPRFVKLANTWNALGREITRFEGDRSKAKDLEHLRKMRRVVRAKIDHFLMGDG